MNLGLLFGVILIAHEVFECFFDQVNHRAILILLLNVVWDDTSIHALNLE